ncbi:Hypothetical predicted protein [Marmota monax]|uniref:Uncharacterized protein n=1 Tax=Marmota monax TaxID=9995 RepID=A0A5E4D604_MARMO|nr:hypothetical protein GHT09_000952 [Marmota monax]VTJ89130.1 Hypothetical predicted protein [Marmota monax]
MKYWAPVLAEVLKDDGNLELEMESESEIGAHFEDQPKGALKKLVYVAKLKASFKTLEREGNQIFTLLSEVIETKEGVIGHIKNLKTEQASLQAENTQFEKELKRTIHFYQGHVKYYEKKTHGNELAAQSAERYLNDLRKQNDHNRQKLTEMEFKFKLAEKDPSALDVSNTAFGRGHSPNGPSPLSQPSCEMRPYVEKKGPLILSPLVTVGEGRGSRGPENSLDHPTSNERRESNCNRLTDPQRAPSDTGPLAPPCQQAHMIMIPPPSQTYSDPQLPLQRQDGCYYNYGTPSEFKSSTMLPLEKMEGSTSSDIKYSRNDIKVNLGDSNLPDSSLPPENERSIVSSGSKESVHEKRTFFPPPPPGNMYGAS